MPHFKIPTVDGQIRELIRQRSDLAGRLVAIDEQLAQAREALQSYAALIKEQPAPHAPPLRAKDVAKAEPSATEPDPDPAPRQRLRHRARATQPAGSLLIRRGGRAPTLSDEDVVSHIRKHAGCSVPSLERQFNASKSMIKRKLYILRRAGLIHAEHRGQSSGWHVGPKAGAQLLDDRPALVPPPTARPLSERERMIAAYVQQHQGCLVAEIALGVHCEKRIVLQRLAALVKLRRIHAAGGGNGARWFFGPPLPNDGDPDQVSTWTGRDGQESDVSRNSSLSPVTLASAGM